MTPYRSRSGKQSSVTGYEFGDDFIIVQFSRRTTYKYSHKSCGEKSVGKMKERALASIGLNTFINQTKPLYE